MLPLCSELHAIRQAVTARPALLHRGAPSDVAKILKKPISQEMLNRDLARLAYVAKDGTPRVVPIAFIWNGTEIVMCTSMNAPKLASLRRNPVVALTIDTEVHPPKILLFRGGAVLDEVEGIPDEYFQMNGTYRMTPEQRSSGRPRSGRCTTRWCGSSSSRRGRS